MITIESLGFKPLFRTSLCPNRRAWPCRVAILFFALSISTALAVATREILHSSNTLTFYYLAVVVAAFFGGYGLALAASAASVLLFTLLVLPPYNAIVPQDQEFMLTFFGMLITGSLVSWLVQGLQKRTEALDQLYRQLKKAELRYRTVADFAYDWETWVDQHGGWLYCSPSCERITGRKAEEFVAQPNLFFDIILPEDRAAVQDHVAQKHHAAAARSALAFRIRHPDGQIVWIEHVCRAVFDDHGAYLGQRASNRDISERKHAEEQLQQINQTLEQRVAEETRKGIERERIMTQQERHAAMGQMLANIAHQWRQPLSLLSIIIQNLREDFIDGRLGEKEVETYVADSMRAILHMTKTIGDFLNFFKPSLHPEAFSALKVIEDCLSLILPSMKTLGIEITIAGPREIELLGHANEFAQVMLNLITNAKDALQEKINTLRQINIAVTAENGSVAVTVRDNAGGIEPENLKTIFDPYFTTKATGTGIGLYMTRLIVEQHMRGTIAAENRGEGAEFRLTFPAAHPPHA